MSEIKALDKLRGLRHEIACETTISPRWMCERADEIADELEAEITDNYMLLPVDADGVPIHLYDKLLKSTGAPEPTYGEVVGISDDSVFFNAKQGWESNWSRCTRHVKPRTLEDIVQDAIQYGYSHGKAGMDVSEQRDKYADEIRELFGGDAE